MTTPPGPSGGAGKPNGVGKAFSQIDLDGHDLPPSPAPSSPRNGRKYSKKRVKHTKVMHFSIFHYFEGKIFTFWQDLTSETCSTGQKPSETSRLWETVA